jgi:Flp pilus assembly protein TadG
MKIIKHPLGYLRSASGNVLIEFALVLPVFIYVLLNLFEFAMYFYLENKLVRLAATVGNNITVQQSLSRQDIINTFNVSETITTPFVFGAKGSLVVSRIGMNPNNPNAMIISWQVKSGTTPSKFGAPGSAPANLPNGITLSSGQALVVTEVFYSYTPILAGTFLSPKTIYRTESFTPRVGLLETLEGE